MFRYGILGIILLFSSNKVMGQESMDNAYDKPWGAKISTGVFVNGELNAVYNELIYFGLSYNLIRFHGTELLIGLNYKFSRSNQNFRLTEFENYVGAIRNFALYKGSFLYVGVDFGLIYSKEFYVFNFSQKPFSSALEGISVIIRPNFGFKVGRISGGPSLEIEPGRRVVPAIQLSYNFDIN